jgi:hypothetical protein
MRKTVKLFLWFAAALLATGCQTVRNGGAPTESFNLDNDIRALSVHFNGPTTIHDYYAIEDEAGRLASRNKFISGRLALIDLNYLQYVRALTTDKQLANIGTELANMSLGLAGTLVGGVRAKTNLAAAATGLGGTKTTIDKEVYYEKSMDALIGSMNAARKELLVEILTGLATKKVDDYPFEVALARLDEYYMAGTIKGALAFITTQAAMKEKASDIEIKNLPTLFRSSPEIIEQKKMLFDALPKLASDEPRARDALAYLGVDQTKIKEFSKVQMLLKTIVDGITSKETIELKQAEIDRIRTAFQKAQLM